MYHGIGEERLLSRERGDCLRADHGVGSGCVGVLSIRTVDLQITSRVRSVVLYYIRVQSLRFLLDKDITQSSLQISHPCIPKARKHNKNKNKTISLDSLKE